MSSTGAQHSSPPGFQSHCITAPIVQGVALVCYGNPSYTYLLNVSIYSHPFATHIVVWIKNVDGPIHMYCLQRRRGDNTITMSRCWGGCKYMHEHGRHTSGSYASSVSFGDLYLHLQGPAPDIDVRSARHPSTADNISATGNIASNNSTSTTNPFFRNVVITLVTVPDLCM